MPRSWKRLLVLTLIVVIAPIAPEDPPEAVIVEAAVAEDQTQATAAVMGAHGK